jgi:hypothetical protein
MCHDPWVKTSLNVTCNRYWNDTIARQSGHINVKNANGLLTLAKTCLNITVMIRNSHHKK